MILVLDNVDSPIETYVESPESDIHLSSSPASASTSYKQKSADGKIELIAHPVYDQHKNLTKITLNLKDFTYNAKKSTAEKRAFKIIKDGDKVNFKPSKYFTIQGSEYGTKNLKSLETLMNS